MKEFLNGVLFLAFFCIPWFLPRMSVIDTILSMLFWFIGFALFIEPQIIAHHKKKSESKE